MNRAELVRRRDEEHAREIESDLHVVVAERVVLRGVQHLEERGGRIALHADRDLVDLVEHQHRVRYAGALQSLHDAPGHGADVRAPVPADLRFVPHAAQRDPHELPVHRSRDRLPERGLADARRADEAQDRPFHADGARGSGGAWRRSRRRGRSRRGRAGGRFTAGFLGPTLPQLLHGKVFDDALFDLVEIVVILVEDAPGFDGIEAILAGLLPGDIQQPVQVRADHLVFRRRRRHPLEAVDLAQRHRFDPLRQMGLRDARPQLLALAVAALAELGLDGFHLLPQQVLPLRVAHLLLGPGFDLAFQLQDFDFARQRHRDRRQLDEDAVFLEELLLVLGLHVDQAGQQVGEPERIVEARHERLDIGREARGQRQSAVDQFLQPAYVRIDFYRALGRFGHRLDMRLHQSAFGLQLLGAHASDALDEHAHAVLCHRHLADDRDRANLVQIVWTRIVRLGALEQQQHHAIAGERTVDGFDRHRTTHAERRNRQWQHYRATDRHHGKVGGQLGRVRHSRSQCNRKLSADSCYIPLVDRIRSCLEEQPRSPGAFPAATTERPLWFSTIQPTSTPQGTSAIVLAGGRLRSPARKPARGCALPRGSRSPDTAW